MPSRRPISLPSARRSTSNAAEEVDVVEAAESKVRKRPSPLRSTAVAGAAGIVFSPASRS